MRLRILLSLALGLAVLTSTLGSNQAYALNRDVRTVLRTGMWGTVAGSTVGLLSFALGSSGRSAFIGASVGLYTGLILGGYFVWERYNPSVAGLMTLPDERLDPFEPLKDQRRLPGVGGPPPLYVQWDAVRF